MKTPSKCELLRRLLSSGAWVHMRKLAAVAGWRYGARLWDLKQRGFGHEFKRDSAGAYWYRRA